MAENNDDEVHTFQFQFPSINCDEQKRQPKTAKMAIKNGDEQRRFESESEIYCSQKDE
jgi:hypothetical protein